MSKPPVCPSHTCSVATALRTLGNASDVKIRWQQQRGATDALASMHELVQAGRTWLLLTVVRPYCR